MLALIAIIVTSNTLSAQKNYLRNEPKAEHLAEARAIAEHIFENFMQDKITDIAEYIVDHIGFTWNPVKRISELNDYKAKLEMMKVGPPNGVYGEMIDYDMIEEGFLPGSARYFRHTYLTYHEASLLTWEFRFYVGKNDELRLHYIGWSETNPFEYMSTSDMLLPLYSK